MELADLERAAESLLAKRSHVTPEGIREIIAGLRQAPIFAVSDDEAEQLARMLEERHQVTMSFGPALIEKGFQPWLEAASPHIDFYYWQRYRKLLEEKHLPAQVIGTLHAETDRILGLLENPKRDGKWNRRGMVVGHVQSGKTANYIGLICKAADAGYRLIVVIAGIHNNLRNQTQKRIDEGLVGRDSARLLSRREERFIGVGRFDKRRVPVTFTTSVRDFSKSLATGVGVPLQTLKEPAVFVIKKNSNTLKHLLQWLEEHNAAQGGKRVDAPMLLIDDEADNASINVAYGKGEVSRINGQIRDLLQMFSRSCYVGYTATPFANIFIDPDEDHAMKGQDLFPRHFIVSLDPPSNYFGPTRIFGGDASGAVRYVDDSQELLPANHAKNHVLKGLPESLKEAIRSFIVARAIRAIRGQGKQHSSMLVNASRFTGMHGQIRSAVQSFLDDVVASVRLSAALHPDRALQDPVIKELYDTWECEYGPRASRWAAVQEQLLEAVASIRVVEVNSRSHGALNYEDHEENGLAVITVGGFSLSRGLTLEGLVVSYFLRNSAMYDTLMQMGRWFGYRPGYEDLCRVWMPEEAEGWYSHVTESTEMLREELRAMAAANATPEDFGLKVRAHPDTLLVTARNKMGSGERVVVKVGLGKQFIETHTLRGDEKSILHNREAARALFGELASLGHSLESVPQVTAGFLLEGVPVGPVKRFLSAFRNHPVSLLTESGPLVKYIEEREQTELGSWDVLVTSVKREDVVPFSEWGRTLGCPRRAVGKRSSGETIRVTNKQRVASRGVERTGLSTEEIERAEASYRNLNNLSESPQRSLNYPDWCYRAQRSRPLLIVHPLEMESSDPKLVPIHSVPYVAWSISFPETHCPEKRVEYIVTTTWLRENMPVEEPEDDIDEDEV